MSIYKPSEHEELFQRLKDKYPNAKISIGLYLRSGYSSFNHSYYFISVDDIRICSDEHVDIFAEIDRRFIIYKIEVKEPINPINKILKKKNPTLADILSLITSTK
jgi:hypothetical protein